MVAPLAGAWIEISVFVNVVLVLFVAPLAGAWIEITERISDSSAYCVAPLAGAWIEISMYSGIKSPVLSLPSRERGLKYA